MELANSLYDLIKEAVAKNFCKCVLIYTPSKKKTSSHHAFILFFHLIPLVLYLFESREVCCHTYLYEET